MEKCPKCGGTLSLAVINGKHCLVCQQCMINSQNKNIEMTKCHICNC